MQFIGLFILLGLSFSSLAQIRGNYISVGLDYPQYPVDIEDVPRGPLPDDNGLPSDDGRFWQTFSIHSKYGLRFEKKIIFYLHHFTLVIILSIVWKVSVILILLLVR